MASHTPGPWKVFEIKHPHFFGGEHTERRIGTAWEHPQLKAPAPVVNLSCGLGEKAGAPVTFVRIDEADAHLIAAAPEMYEALIEVERVLRKPSDPHAEIAVLQLVRAVIATAEGRESHS